MAGTESANEPLNITANPDIMHDPDILVDTWFLLAPEQRLILEQRLDVDDPLWIGLMPWQADRDAATQEPAPDLDTGC